VSLNRYDKKRDANEREIIQALESTGIQVWQMDRPLDLLCLKRRGGKCYWFLLEVKDKGGGMTAYQRNFFQDTEGAARAVVRSVEEALAVAESI